MMSEENAGVMLRVGVYAEINAEVVMSNYELQDG